MKRLLLGLLFGLLLNCPNVFAVKVLFKATPMSENLIKGPYAVYVFYKIYDDTTDVSNINGIIDMPLLKREDIRNVKIKKSGKLIKGQKPKFKVIEDGLNKTAMVRSFGITDYDIVQGDTYAYMLYFNSNENESNISGLKKSGPNNVKVDSASITHTNLSIDYENDSPKISNYLEPPGEGGGGGGTTTATITLGNPDIAYAKLNNVFREASHNTFQSNIVSVSEGGFFKALSYSRVVELDIWGTFLSNDDGWDVYHQFSLDNNCGSNGGGSFSVCLDDIVTFHNLHPDHDPIMVFIQLNSSWSIDENRTTVHFEGLLLWKFGNDIYKPSDFSGSNTDMRLMAQKNNTQSNI